MIDEPRPPGTGLFVVLEGLEGSGKSTQCELLGAWLDEMGLGHVITREPGGTEAGEAIRELVLERTDLDLPAESELLLVLAARAAFVRDVVRPALARGEIVVSDRYAMSTLAYQGWGRQLDLERVRRLNAFATGGLEPDLYLLLDVPVGGGLERQRRMGKEGDRFETAGDDFLARVAAGYEAMSGQPSVCVVPATGPVGEVQERLRDALRTAFPETFGVPRR